MGFLKDNGMYYVVRLKKTVNVDSKPITELDPGIYEDIRVHKTIGNVYLKGYLTIRNKREEKNELNLKLLNHVERSEVLGR